MAGDNESATSLNYGYMVAVIVVILRDVMSGITAPYYDSFFALGTGFWTMELRRVDKEVALEVGKAGNVRGESSFAANASGLDNMARVECVWLMWKFAY